MDVSKVLSQAKAEPDHCSRHGAYQNLEIKVAGRQIWAGCPDCDAEQQQEEKSREVAAISERSKQAALEYRFRSACIPPRFKERTLDNYKPGCPGSKEALRMAREYADNFPGCLSAGRSLIFCGRPGTGKTHLAAGIANWIIKGGHTATFFSTINAVRRVRETYRRDNPETEREAIQTFTLPDLLILDEVGQQRGTDDEKIILFDIINARYEAIRPTIIISNLDLEGIKKHLGERAFDRLREGDGRAVQFTWKSYRQ